MPDDHEDLNQLLAQSSVSKIVYSLVMPETEAVIDRVLDGADGESKNGRELFHNMFREAWTQKQDAVHESFFETWLHWISPIVQLDSSAFGFAYPTSGASEAIREAIYAYGARSRRRSTPPTIHVFDGEYEGFTAYASAVGIDVKSHNRQQWSDAIDQMNHHDQFYISQPSAIDGMIWQDFDRFAMKMHTRRPEAELMLDLTYVGCVGKEFRVVADHPNIAVVFISLSKPAGVYYHRVGGMLSRNEYPGLFGNKWFKNLTSLRIGTEFMHSHGVNELPRKYRPIQEQVIAETNHQLGLRFEAADVLLLATGMPSERPSPLELFLMRGSEGEKR
ncbi:MAG: hypothetical protein KDB00_11770, partial [Planctomycetales bacterium]|nr:hypothetical protein [Planctomycetales bacterium]